MPGAEQAWTWWHFHEGSFSTVCSVCCPYSDVFQLPFILSTQGSSRSQRLCSRSPGQWGFYLLPLGVLPVLPTLQQVTTNPHLRWRLLDTHRKREKTKFQICSSFPEELPLDQGQWRRPRRAPGCDGAGAAERSYPTSEVGGGGREEQPHVQGAEATQAQEGWEELLHFQGQEQLWRDTPRSR